MQTIYKGQDGPDTKITMTFTGEVAPNPSAVIISYFDDTILGNAVPAYMMFHLVSILASVLVLAIVVSMLFVNPKAAKRPSMRISACIAVVDIGNSSVCLALFAYPFMSSQPQASLYVVGWLAFAFQLTSTLLTTCITFHLMLTVLLRKECLAYYTNYCYEAFCFTFGFAIPTLSFRLFPDPIWNPYYISMQYLKSEILGSGLSPNARLLLCAYLWELICIGFCVIMCILLALKLSPVLQRMHKVELTMPEGDVAPDADSNARPGLITHNDTNRRTRIRNSVPRISGHSVSNNHLSSGYNSANATTAIDLNNTIVEGSPQRTDHEHTQANEAVLPQFENSPTPSTAKPSINNNSGNGENNELESPSKPNITAYASTKQRKQIRRTIQRILLYPIEMIIFRFPTIISNMTGVSDKTGFVIHTMLSVHGIFNLVVFLFNPGLDEFWPWFKFKVFGHNAKVRTL